jgi:hypothetical protein
MLEYAVSYSEGFPLSPIAFVLAAVVSDVFPFWSLPGL